MDLQQTRGSNVSGVDGNVRLSCWSQKFKKKKGRAAKRKMTVGIGNKNKSRTGHVVVVATSLVGRHDPRQSDLAELLAVVAAPPIDQ
jgi:hypothetical protein